MRNLMPLTYAVTTLVVIHAVCNSYVVLMIAPYLGWSAITLGLAALGALLLLFVTMIVFGIWIYRAGKNLVAEGCERLEFTPAARIWWFAVPFANLIMPYRGMRELWNASRGQPFYGKDQPILIVWWAIWLAAWLLSVLSRVGVIDDRTLAVTGSVISFAQAPLAIVLLFQIAGAQRHSGGAPLTDVFA